MHTQIEKALDRFLEDRQTLDVPGNGLLVNVQDREVYRHFTGSATADTLFRVYSMTKVVTVTAALQLFEQGLFAMDDPLFLYIPEYAHMTVWDPQLQQAVPARNPIRIRDLFCMSAGLTYNGSATETERRITALEAETERQYPGRSCPTLEFVRRLASVPLLFEPGTHWRYSLCHDVLGGLVEVLSGQTLGEYMQEHIFAPLGMTHTFFRCPEALRANLADCRTASAQEDARYAQTARYESGGGGLLSTADDYMRFASVLTRGGTGADGVRILSRKTIDLLRLDQLDSVQKQDFNWRYLKGYSYGLGVRTLVSPAAAGIPGSVGEFGWCGVLGTWVLMDPTEQLTAVYMHQRTPNLEEYVQTHLRPMIYSLLD